MDYQTIDEKEIELCNETIEELEIKLEMCSFFGIKPFFIMRYAPNPTTILNAIYC